jgi:Transposase DDE domain
MRLADAYRFPGFLPRAMLRRVFGDRKARVITLVRRSRGRPVAVSVHDGNTSDCETFLPQVQRLRQSFGIEKMVIVGDRGMISQKSIDEIRHTDGIDWITALKSGAIRMLIDDKHVQPDLFDERNLFEFTHLTPRRTSHRLPEPRAREATRS